MRKVIGALALVFMASGPVAAHEAHDAHDWFHSSNTSFNVKFFLGSKSLQDSGWGQHDNQFVFGMDFDQKAPDWPVSVLLSASFSASGTWDAGEARNYGFVREVDFGFRKYLFDESPMGPYFSLGVALVNAGVARDYWVDRGYDQWHGHGQERRWDAYDDFTTGLFINAGFDMRVVNGRVGLDIRAVTGTETMRIEHKEGVITGNGDYIQVGITFGIGI